MTKSLILGVAAFAMMTGVAFAQSTLSDTTITTHSTTAPADGSYKSNKTQKTIDSNGTEVVKSQTYTSGSTGTNASSTTQTTAPDGTTLNTSQDDRTVSPGGGTTTTSHTTTNSH